MVVLVSVVHLLFNVPVLPAISLLLPLFFLPPFSRCDQNYSFCVLSVLCYSKAKNGPFKIKTNTTLGTSHIYCQMTSLPGCDGGGWTMVMKIDGNKVI